MAIKSGQLVFLGDNLLIDRLQSANINPSLSPQYVYELGNQFTLTALRDTPDLSFDCESYDVSCKMEAILLGINPSTLTTGQQIDFNLAQPLTVASPFRSSQNLYNIVNGAVVPHLGLESVAYKFGVKQDASQTYTLKGDSIFYIPGVPQEDVFTSNGSTTTFALSQTAIEYVNTTIGQNQYVLNVSVYNPDGTFYRLFNGTEFDYTDTSTSFTLNAGTTAPLSGALIRAQYGCAAGTGTDSSVPYSANVADGITVKPAAILARNIDVFLGNGNATPTFTRLTGVQSFDLTWKVNLDANEELGNPNVVSQDYVTAQVSGSFTSRDNNIATLFAKIYQASNVSSGQVIGALSSTPIPMEIHLNNPGTGARLKTLYCPDARFDPPAIQAKVNQKLDTPFKFTSDTGQFFVYNGARPGGNATP